MATKPCKEEGVTSDGWRSHRCSNKAKRDDYCLLHHPDEKAKRAKKRGPTEFQRRVAAAQRGQENLLELVAAARDFYDKGGSGERLLAALEPYE